MICYNFNNRCKFVQCKIDDDCYDGICTENRCKFVDNTEYITITGKVSAIKNSDIKFFNMEGIFLGATNSDDTGNYSISIDKSIYFDGYRIEVSSGTYGEDAETKIYDYDLVVTDVKTGIEHKLSGKIDIMDTVIVLEGVIGVAGGEISDHWGDYVLTVEEDTVTEDT